MASFSGKKTERGARITRGDWRRGIVVELTLMGRKAGRGKMICIAIDLGSPKIEIAALDESGRVIARHRTAMPPGSYRDIPRTVAEA